MSVRHAPEVAIATATADSRYGLLTSEPVVFETFTGCFQPTLGPDGIPVLMLSPYGYEELCGRAFWNALADGLAAAGMPSLRFDLPGTGNALDVEADGIEDWRAAALSAAEALRRRSGRNRIALLGQGLGATLAMQWAPDLGPLGSIVLLEPAASGRSYLRGLKAWGATIAAASGLPPDAAAINEHAVAGFPVPEARAAAIRALDLANIKVPQVPAILILEQPGGGAGKLLSGRLGSNGTEVVRHDFKGYADLNTDPTSAQIPGDAIAAVADWLSGRGGMAGDDDASPAPPASVSRGADALHGDGFIEQPIRFGRVGTLAGVLCLPDGPDERGSAIVLVSAGRDHSIGWARSATGQARALARQGVASLRFDLSGVGDSRAPEGATGELLYAARMCDDVRAAIDHLAARGHGPIGLVGRCSGAWASFTVAVDDPRVHSLVLVNPGYFLWDSSKKLADVIRFAQRNIGDLGATLLRRNSLGRLLKGQLDWRGAVRFVLRQANRYVLRRYAPLLGRLTAESRRYHDLHALFGRLKSRNVQVLLAYSEGDTSLEELRSFMGTDLRKLRRYPGVSAFTVMGADHNMTPAKACAVLRDRLVEFFGQEGKGRQQSRDARLDIDAVPRSQKSYAVIASQH